MIKKNKWLGLLPLLLLFCFVFSCKTQNYEVIVLGGTIFDGSGSPGYQADIGISEGRIQKIGKLKRTQGIQVIEAEGKYVVPGFIDIHTHCDSGIGDPRRKDALSYLSQGVTTLVGGNCGGGTYNVSDYFLKLEEQGIGPNIVHLVGHGTVREAVLEYADKAPNKEEMEKMKALVEKAMSEGALGLSSGLFYAPGSYARTEELIELCKVVKKYNGIYATHLRDESNYGIGLLSAVEEAIEIGEKSGVPVQISHIKALGKPVWGLSQEVSRVIEEARSRGVAVTADQYPYNASSTSLTAALVPLWVQAGGRLRELLSGSSQLKGIKEEIAENINRRGGAETLVIASSRNYSGWEGKSLQDISVGLGKNTVDTAIEMVLNGGASIVSFNMTDEDIEYFMAKSWVMTGSDGSLFLFGSSQPHPRSYGTFSRKIRSYVLDKKILSMEQAVRAATGLPAEVLGFSDRGMLKRGFVADIVVFDPNSIQDNATYSDPHQYSSGIFAVLISGKSVIEEGEYNGTLAGKPLRKGQDF
ncbi:MAG: amidohydrolase family protein [Candidatus Aminicenantes bacterium]|nr:amidohydrolase family protein [Candidatus Aminicenantes bacterium]